MRERKLTPRQMQVRDLLLSGMRRVDIENELGIAKNTVDQHAKWVYRYYGVHTHAELMIKKAKIKIGVYENGSK